MSDSLFSVQDQVVLVSGGSRGIGKALAAGFAARGAKVVITGRNEETLAATAAEIAVDGNVESVVCDVAQVESVTRAVEQVHSKVRPH